MLGIGNLSIEAARRRAGLVAQLRFAVTLQDMRTVVLLRRQLAQEKPRNRPWIRLRPRRGRLPADLAPRLAELPALPVPRAAAHGGAGRRRRPRRSASMWRGATAMFIVAGLALYLAGYDAVEPLAQEVDHPTRWESYPRRQRPAPHPAPAGRHRHHGRRVRHRRGLRRCLVPGEVVGQLAVPMILTVAVGATIGAAVSTVDGRAQRRASTRWRSGPTCSASCWSPAWSCPPAIAVVSLMPLLAAGRDPDAHQHRPKVSNAVFYPLILIFGAGMYLRYRKPSHL